MKIKSLLMLSITILMLAGNATAGKAAPAGRALTPVNAVFRCALGRECNEAGADDAIVGDAVGPYRGRVPAGATTTPEGTAENNESYFTSDFRFLFVLKTAFSRYISIDLSRIQGTPSCAAANKCRKNFSSVYTNDSLPGNRTWPVNAQGAELSAGFNGIAIGQTVNARHMLNFKAGSTVLYTLRFDPVLFPGSKYVKVTRVSSNEWTIEATDSDLAQLVSSTGTSRSNVNEGSYAVPFKISVTQ